MPREPLGDVAPPKASHLPSGVQERLPIGLKSRGIGGGKIVAMVLSAPPSAGITTRSAAVGGDAKRTNAMKRPSGDHAGQSSGAGLVVKRTGSAGTGQFDVDVVVVQRRAVPGKGDPASVGREARRPLVSRIRSERNRRAGEVLTADVRGSRTTVRNVTTTSKAAVTVAPASHAFLVLRLGITEEGSFFALLTGSADDLADGMVARTSALNR